MCYEVAEQRSCLLIKGACASVQPREERPVLEML